MDEKDALEYPCTSFSGKLCLSLIYAGSLDQALSNQCSLLAARQELHQGHNLVIVADSGLV